VASKDSSGQFRTINEALQAAVPATTRSAGSPSSSKKESTRRRFTIIGEGAGKSIGDNRGEERGVSQSQHAGRSRTRRP
jgi:hypothetical protein